jgi:hypothetical protein
MISNAPDLSEELDAMGAAYAKCWRSKTFRRCAAGFPWCSAMPRQRGSGSAASADFEIMSENAELFWTIGL